MQTGFDIAEALAMSELGEHHAEKLIETGKVPHTVIALVLADATVENMFWHEGHQLREEILPSVHCQDLSTAFYGKV